MAVYAYHRWHERTLHPARKSPTKRSSLEAIIAIFRSALYTHFSGRMADVLGLPSVVSILSILGTAISTVIAIFAVRPYYRERDVYGSPPLAFRAGMMSQALTLIVVALARKFNVSTLLTGVDPERLDTMHRYLAWFCFALAVAHTVPFSVAPLEDGVLQQLNMNFYSGGITGGMVRQSRTPSYIGSTTVFRQWKYNGIAPLDMLFFPVAFLIITFVTACTSFFAYSYILAAIVCFGLMLWHTNNNLQPGSSFASLPAPSQLPVVGFTPFPRPFTVIRWT